MSGTDRERARRLGLNEAIFRRVNEQLDGLAQKLGDSRQPLDLICECGNLTCDQRIRLTRQEYESIRVDPVLFAVVPGHEELDVEDVVRHGREYDVVRKRPGTPEHVARATDTRVD